MNIQRPKIETLPLEDGLRWNGAGCLTQEKADGCWHPLEWRGHWFNAERMRDGSFVVNDLIASGGQDMRHEPLTTRWRELCAIAATLDEGMSLCRTGAGGEFLRDILDDGGEGIVAKSWDAPFGYGWHKCKRLETFDVTVADASGPLLSVAIEFEGVPAGRVPVLSLSTREALRNGDVIEISAQSRHPSGKFREPRFIRTRPDKQEVAP